ncbi:hypothetical protein [Streptomyces sp. HUAS TT20]|uniref:hypothetical protein n=1 Tax=Streptomyces sp. HUAS TT20 TaxID=3447509 RepID=UPI0021DA538E|nr:hypothetical protein [Streptomyces sp. HUAS 15-9]UXY32970.1 hypothetical protein N8I87_42425 [Streptomyces sp. HUAS 15-9]
MADTQTAPAPPAASAAPAKALLAPAVDRPRTPGGALPAAVLGLGCAWSPFSQTGLTLGHALTLLIVPVCLAAVWRVKAARWYIGLLCLWLLAAAVAEYAAGDSLHQTLLALSRPVAVLLSFCGAMWVLQHKPAVVRVYVVTFTIGLLANIALFLHRHPSTDPWKYGYGPVVGLAVVLISFRLVSREKHATACVLILSLALVNILQGFRSEFLVVSLAGAVAMLVGRRVRTPDRKRILLVAAALVCLFTAVGAAYGHLASSGSLGVEQQKRWERQSGGEGGVLVGARPEIAASYVIVEDSPLIGQGFKPAVDYRTRSAFMEKLRAEDGDFNQLRENFYFGNGLYLHSVLFQLWAETGAGVLPGIVFPLAMVFLALGLAVKRGAKPYALLFTFLCAQLGWDILFSPWPRLEGLYLGTATAAAVLYRHAWSQSAAVVSPQRR